MKEKFLFFLLLIMSLQMNVNIYAAIESKMKQQIVLKTKAQNSHRSIPILPTAFIDGSLLSIDFLSVVSPVTITVRNAETSEIVYSSAGWDVNKIEIDLTGENPGKYILDIVCPTTTFAGDFEL